MQRDIDYAATAVKTALVTKYAKLNDLEQLEVVANDRTISVRDGERSAEGTRDDLLAGVRKANTYAELWDVFAEMEKAVRARAL